MKRRWHPDELITLFTLTPQEHAWLSGHTGAVQLGRAVLLTCMQYEGRFPHQPHDVPAPVVEYLAQQIGVSAKELRQYDWAGRRGQMDGIQKAKDRGVQFGAKPKLTDEQIVELRQRRENGVLIRELMQDYRISKATIYRYLDVSS